MDYLLSCPHPRYVSYFRFLQAYANGCHILSLPFVESSAKIEFEHMLRRRFMGVQNVNPASIDHLVLQAAWIPLMPRSFFEPRNSISKLHKKTFANRKAKHLRVNIPPLPKQSSLCIVTTVTTPPSSIEEDLPINPAPLKIKKQSNNNSKAIKKVVEPKRSKSISPVSALAADPNCEKDLFELVCPFHDNFHSRRRSRIPFFFANNIMITTNSNSTHNSNWLKTVASHLQNMTISYTSRARFRAVLG